jgi:hypothetical protein
VAAPEGQGGDALPSHSSDALSGGQGGGDSSREAEALANALYGGVEPERAACAAAESFLLSEHLARRDSEALTRLGSVAALVTERQSSMASSRLSLERLRRFKDLVPTLAGQEEFELLLRKAEDLIVGGLEVFPPEDFTPCTSPALPRRRKFIRMEQAILKLAAGAAEKEFCLLLPTELLLLTAARAGEVLHFSPAGWAPKRGKVGGRFTFDPRLLTTPRKWAREAATQRYGAIQLPQLRDLMEMLLSMEDEHGNEQLRAFKLDLAGAFHLLFLSVPSTLLMCCEVSLSYSVVWITGNFGHVDLPYAFNIVSRLLDLAGNALGFVPPVASGHVPRAFSLRVYVDDTMGLRLIRLARHAISHLTELYRSLLGPGSVADEKTEDDQRLITWIGWTVDLDQRTVRMADHVLLKLVHYLGRTRGNHAVVADLEVVASLVERFSAVCPVLHVFKGTLYASYCKVGNRHAKVAVAPLVSTILALVRSLSLESWNGHGYSLDSFRPRVAQAVVEFDDSVYGIGARVFLLDAESKESLALELSLPLPSSVAGSDDLRVRSQNSCELLAAVTGCLAALFVLPPGPTALSIRGDSVVALEWLAESSFRSSLTTRTALAWTCFAHRHDVMVSGRRHIPAVPDNEVCDGYSRGSLPMLRPGVTRVTPEDTSPVSVLCSSVVQLCNAAIAEEEPLHSPSRLDAFLSRIAHLPLPHTPPLVPPPSFLPPAWGSAAV